MFSKSFFFHLFLNLDIKHLWPVRDHVLQLLTWSWSQFECHPQLVQVLWLVRFIVWGTEWHLQLLSKCLTVNQSYLVFHLRHCAVQRFSQENVHNVLSLSLCIWMLFHALNGCETLHNEAIILDRIFVFAPHFHFPAGELTHGVVPMVEVEVSVFCGHS